MNSLKRLRETFSLAIQEKKKFFKATLRILNIKALLHVREVSNAVKFC